MFRQLGIWSHVGQNYTPEDASQLMYYKESVTGQIFQEGINERVQCVLGLFQQLAMLIMAYQ